MITWILALALASPPKQLVTGEDFSCALYSDGHIECWGNNEDGQAGLPKATPRAPKPSRLTTGGATDLAASAVTGCAVLQSGELQCWGQVARASWGHGLEPTRITGTRNLAGVALGPGSRGCVRMRGGTVSCWEESGERMPVFKDIPKVTMAVQLAVGRKHACALLQGGAVWCWGDDRRGQLGQGKPGWPASALPVPDLHDAISVSTGDDLTCAVRKTGKVLCWGPNDDGGLGLGHTEPAWGVQEVPGVRSARQVVVGSGEVCARTVEGKVLCWGTDPCPRPSAPSRRLSPIDIGWNDVRLLSEGGHSDHRCAVVGSEIKCWGFNSHGQALGTDRCVSP